MIKHTEKELLLLRDEVSRMWQLVLSQLEKSKQAMLDNDLELAHEVISREKRVDAFELKVSADGENYIALYSPVAVDLRLVLALIRICGTLERIGDFAEGIARFVIANTSPAMIQALKEPLQLKRMFEKVISMLSESFVLLESENTKLSGKILIKDEAVDELYHNALEVLAAHIGKNPADAVCALETMIVLRKIERVGDHCSNIVEEIVFYVDAKVLKHHHKNNEPDAPRNKKEF